MICQQCGTEIADKAIVCFRCGRSVSAPAASPMPASRDRARQPLWLALAAVLVLVAAGLFMARAAAGQLPPWMSYTVAGLAAMVLAWRVMRRRR